jgi:hypothetical protein
MQASTEAIAKPALDVPDHADREADQPLGHAAGGQELRRQDKERDRQQRVVRGQGLEQLQRDGRERIVGEQQDGDDAGEAERDGDRACPAACSRTAE